MTVETLLNQLKLAKNKKAEVIFKAGNNIVKDVTLTEVVLADDGTIKHPVLGETTNAIAVLLGNITNE